MNILQTPVRFYPAIGGVETVVLGLSRALAQRGHRVHVLTSDEPSAQPTQLDGVRITRLRTAAKLANTNITPALPLHLMREPFDIVHTHLPTPWSADWSAWMGRVRGKAVVTSFYNEIVGQTGAASAFAKTYNATAFKALLRASHRLITLTPEHISSPISPLKNALGKTRLLKAGIDTAQFAPMPELRQPNVVSFLAVLDEFHRYKGLDVLLRAMAQVRARNAQARLRVGGQGALRGEYERMAAELGLGANVEFLGRLPDAQLAPFFNQSSVFVLPSTSGAQEGYGLVALEAMACGVPVITTSEAGLAPIAQQANAALVVPAGNAAALANAIERVLGDPALAAQLSANGQALIQNKFSWAAIAQEYESVYAEAIKQSV